MSRGRHRCRRGRVDAGVLILRCLRRAPAPPLPRSRFLPRRPWIRVVLHQLAGLAALSSGLPVFSGELEVS